MKTNKAFRELREKAARLEAERLTKQGYVVSVQLVRDPDSPTPLDRIPAIYEVSDLEAHKRAREAAKAAGIREDLVPPPVALLDYSAWTFYPTCPNCNARRLEVHGIGYIDGRDPELSTKLAAIDAGASARCLRPANEARPERSCGWAGTAGELRYSCFSCGERKAGAVSGECPECSGAPAPKSGGARKKAARKKRAKRAG